MIRFHCSNHNDYSLYWYIRQFTLNQFNPTWRARFNESYSGVIVLYDLFRNILEIRTSTITHAYGGVFTTVPIGAQTVITYYYGTLLSDNLSTISSHSPAVYGEGSFLVPLFSLNGNCTFNIRQHLTFLFGPFQRLSMQSVLSTLQNILKRCWSPNFLGTNSES